MVVGWGLWLVRHQLVDVTKTFSVKKMNGGESNHRQLYRLAGDREENDDHRLFPSAAAVHVNASID
jgi:hypothetical protein